MFVVAGCFLKMVCYGITSRFLNHILLVLLQSWPPLCSNTRLLINHRSTIMRMASQLRWLMMLSTLSYLYFTDVLLPEAASRQKCCCMLHIRSASYFQSYKRYLARDGCPSAVAERLNWSVYKARWWWVWGNPMWRFGINQKICSRNKASKHHHIIEPDQLLPFFLSSSCRHLLNLRHLRNFPSRRASILTRFLLSLICYDDC